MLRNECAVTQKIDLMMAKKSIPVEEELKMPQINYHKQLRDFANAIEPTPIQESWIENIKDVRLIFVCSVTILI